MIDKINEKDKEKKVRPDSAASDIEELLLEADAEQEEDTLEDYAEIRYLDPAKTSFARTEGGFISMKVKASEEGKEDEDYSRVFLHRAFPFSHDREFVSVRYNLVSGEGNLRETEIREAGLIRRIDDFSPEDVKLIDEELNRRYFVPVIETIKSIKDEFGYYYWEVVTNSGFKRFTAADLSNNILPIGNYRVIVIDLDGNRYEIPDYRKIEEKFLKFIEMWL